MLPSSKSYLSKAGFSSSSAEWIRLGCFVGGFIGIQVVSRFLHRFIPSHVVDCDHSHVGTPPEGRSNQHSRTHSRGQGSSRRHSRHAKAQPEQDGKTTEATPLLNGINGHGDGRPRAKSARQASFRGDTYGEHRRLSIEIRRPSMLRVQSRVMSFVKDTKSECDEGGPCYGYSDPCGQECFKHLSPLSAFRRSISSRSRRDPPLVLETPEEEDETTDMNVAATAESADTTRVPSQVTGDNASEADSEDLEAQHHHHVPTNAFMNIGLQTSIAIALHKLPEGFITYATNHANPTLGFTVFMALFIHNITEGFAMALPLYLALGSRFQAMFWSSLLGGFSQPLGAGIAAMWFHLAKTTDHAPGFAVYGCMFAVTAGIMSSVALSLFVESLSVNHNTQLCVASALVGMSILGISNALTA